MAAAAAHTLRVNQLDALRVDEELLLLLQQEVGAALQHTFPAAAGTYSRELQLLLQLFFFCSYTLRNAPTPGALLQNVRYQDISTSGSNGNSGGRSRRTGSSRSSTTGSRSSSVSDGLRSDNSGTGQHRNSSGTGTARDSSISTSSDSTHNRAAEHVAGERKKQQHQRQLQHKASQRLPEQQGEPPYAEVQDTTRLSSRKSPAVQQTLSLKQRLLLLLMSLVLPYCFERVQEYIQKRYVALLAVLQQRMLRAQALRRMQQQQLLRQQQLQQQSSVQQQQSHQRLQHQHLRQWHPSPFHQQHQRQQHGGCCNSEEGSSCSRRMQECHSGDSSSSTDDRRNSRDNRVGSAAQTSASRVAPRDAPGAHCGCGRSETPCLSTRVSVTCAAAPSFASAAPAVSASAAPSSSAGAEAPHSLAVSTVLLSSEENRILQVYKASQVAELLVSVAQLLQTLCFLATGRYRCLSDWLLLLRMQHIDPSLHRSITLDLLQQQLAWQAVLQLLLMVLPELPQQQVLLRVVMELVRRIPNEVTTRMARARASCIVFLQQQIHRRMPTRGQQQEHTQPHMGGGQQEEGPRHEQHEHRREDNSPGAPVQRALFRATSQQHQEKQKQTEERGLLEEEGQQPQQQQQCQRAQRTLVQLKTPHTQLMTRHHTRSTRRAASRTSANTELLMQQDRRKHVVHGDSSGERPFHRMHASRQSVLYSVRNWLRYSSVDIQSRIVRRSCLLLLRILRASPIAGIPVTAAYATTAAAGASDTSACVIDAAERPAAKAAAVSVRAATPAGGPRRPRGHRDTRHTRSTSSSERMSSAVANAERSNAGGASASVSPLKREERASTGLLQRQHATSPSTRPVRRHGSGRRHGTYVRQLGEELTETLPRWGPAEVSEQGLDAIQHQQEQQVQQQERDQEKEPSCVFCGRDEISLAFRGSNCSHRFCYYCVAAHPIYRQHVKRQRAATATSRRARHDCFTQSAGDSLTSRRANSPAAKPAAEVSLGAAAEARGVNEGGQLIRTLAAGHRGQQTSRNSLNICEEAQRPERSGKSSNSSTSGSTRCSGEEKPKRSWFAFFRLMLDEEEASLKCPACSAVVENIQWVV